MQKRIANFLNKKYLCTLSVADDKQPWAVACFYKFDEANCRLIYMSSEQTTHSKILHKNPQVAGTIFSPTRFHSSIQGIQFLGIVNLLSGEEAKIARELYEAEFKPYVDDRLAIWEVKLEQVRLIDNSLGKFGKMEWKKGDPEVRDDFQTIQLA
ncbi:pyridoxamine 5'-phosphate oxidase family protein [Actinobacillus equuli subsp. equuli]|uniref:Pyridoxamine 5'-phosphate oxidase family protein n=1 Tax=Actinobacillus equuli subsp. equuli TaxID=202947 RepID=A0A9X4G1V1_ACTEU|nr:pyridoxamine 5'-phosphate oxidase family protein [Actinobacillus equuli]MDE8034252.1 pyridoxamine 5'-phosphate oxidase family protein [Actinobacillus equuli subsp. equuli]MDG4947940.1 pyridoxamine 5'-phosphate oxidase family protein [Actinobacillus equuli subsp. haemolyticus]